MAAGASMIQLTGVSMSFKPSGNGSNGRARTVHALDRIDVDVAPGEFVTMLGPSGCGKSTLLRLITGRHAPTTGTISVDGGSAAQARAAKRFGLVPQAPALVPWKTVAGNVRLLSSLRHRVGSAAMPETEIDRLLAVVGLDRFVDAYPHELSGGMQQRVALVRAFAVGAPILLMDEPFAALDEMTRDEMRYLLLELWAQRRGTVVFVTHSVAEAVILSDRVLVMSPRPGRIVGEHRIDLPRPRAPEMEDAAEFHDAVREIRSTLRGCEAIP